jgi:hypothetical protein
VKLANPLWRCTFPGCSEPSVIVWAVWLKGDQGQEVAARCHEHRVAEPLGRYTACSVIDCGRIASCVAHPLKAVSVPLCKPHETLVDETMPGVLLTH